MIYEYYCEECKKIIQEEKSMKEDILPSIVCSDCKKEASRIWNNMSIHIPEFMKATSNLYGSDSASNYDYISGRMKKGTRPSGKDKTFY